MEKIEFVAKNFEKLDNRELFEIYKLRNEVFIVEQNCAYQDLDDLDFKSIHILGKADERIVSYARLIPCGEKYDDMASIGRFLVSKNYREKSIANDMLSYILEYSQAKSKENPGYLKIRISAQEYIKSFYEKHGFKQTSEVYIEEFRPHLKMELNLGDYPLRKEKLDE